MEKTTQDTEMVRRERTLAELKSLLDSLPSLGKEAEAFEKDIAKVMWYRPYLLSLGDDQKVI